MIRLACETLQINPDKHPLDLDTRKQTERGKHTAATHEEKRIWNQLTMSVHGTGDDHDVEDDEGPLDVEMSS